MQSKVPDWEENETALAESRYYKVCLMGFILNIGDVGKSTFWVCDFAKIIYLVYYDKD